MESQWLTPGQVASRLQIALNTIYLWLRKGRLPGVQVGRRWRVRPEDLDAFLRESGPTGRKERMSLDAPSVWELAAAARARIPPEELARIPNDAVENLDAYLYGAHPKGAGS